VTVVSDSITNNNRVDLILPTKSFKTTPGLSARALDPTGVAFALQPLLKFAREQVPEQTWKQTEIHLMATAGLRHIEQHLSESIIDACRETLRESGFLFAKDDWAFVLPGTKEASYGWTAVNYAYKALAPEKSVKETYAVLELGGASMQVTYAISAQAAKKNVVQKKHKETIRVGDSVKHLYASSLLGLGHEAARAEYHSMLRKEYESTGAKPKSPCTNKGWTAKNTVQHGEALAVGAGPSLPTGNFSECYEMTKKLLGLANNDKECLKTPCGMRKMHLPPFDGKYLATENFYYTAQFFKLGKTITFKDFERAGEKLCAESWEDVVKKYFRKDQKKWEEIDLSKYCFSAAFIVAMLKDGMLLPEDAKITVGNSVGRYNVDWAMGAALNIVSTKLAKKEMMSAEIINDDDSLSSLASPPFVLGSSSSSSHTHTHEANDVFWWSIYIITGFFGCSKFLFSGVWELLFFKFVSIVRRIRDFRKLRGIKSSNNNNKISIIRDRGRGGGLGSNTRNGMHSSMSNFSNKSTSSLLSLGSSINNRSQSSRFLASMMHQTRKGSFHDLTAFEDSMV